MKLAFFSSSLASPLSVSTSASLSEIGVAAWDTSEDCRTDSSSSGVVDIAGDSDKLFISFESLCTRDLQIDIAFWQYGMASWAFEPISKHKHIRKFLYTPVKVATKRNVKE